MTIANSIIRKQILNERFARGLARRYLKELEIMLERAAQMIRREPNNARIQAIIQDLDRMVNVGLQELLIRVKEDVDEFAVEEVAFLNKVMELNSSAVLRAPDAGKIIRYLETAEMKLFPGADALRLGEALSAFSEAQKNNITRIIQDGLIFGETNEQISNKILALRTGKTQAQTRALTRTLTNFASSQAQRAFTIENKAVFDAEEWISVLDSRTTLICAGRDGNVYPTGRGPYPPEHYNCRSRRLPVLKKDFEKVGQKSNRENFESWFQEQDKSFQEEFFGDKPQGLQKLELYRKGDLRLEQFRDETGKEYTLKELQGLYPQAFRDAGIEI